MISGGKYKFQQFITTSICKQNHQLPIFDSEPNPVQFGEYHRTFIHKFISQMIRFHQ